jgi:hypothetical protein
MSLKSEFSSDELESELESEFKTISILVLKLYQMDKQQRTDFVVCATFALCTR